MDLFEKKYYPKRIDQLLLDNDFIELLNFLINIKQLNILLHGNEQCGKTTIINTLIEELKNRNIINNKNIYYLNNFNEQTFVQNLNELKNFCNSTILSNELKIVVIDDINNFNENNQQNLKNIVEFSKKNTFFICSIDNINDLIEPLQSYFIQIKCNGLNKEKLISYVKNISNENKINLSDEDIINIINHSELNFNIIMNYIEKKFLLNNITISSNFFINIEEKHYNMFIDYCKENNFKAAYDILINFSKKGYFFLDILEEFYQFIKKDKTEINYNLINLICNYINKFYDGYDNKIKYFFFTHDVIEILNS